MRIALVACALAILAPSHLRAGELMVELGVPELLLPRQVQRFALDPRVFEDELREIIAALALTSDNEAYHLRLSRSAVPMLLDTTPLSGDMNITAIAPTGRQSRDGNFRFVGACDNNPCSLWLNGVLTQESNFMGTSFFTQVIRTGSSVRGMAPDEVYYKSAAFDEPNRSTIRIFGRLSGVPDYQPIRTIPNASSLFFHRWEFGFDASRDFLATAFREIPSGNIAVDLMPVEGEPVQGVLDVGTPSTPPTAAQGQIAARRIPTGVIDFDSGCFNSVNCFHVAWLGTNNTIRAAIINAATRQAWGYDLGLFTAAFGIMNLSLFATDRGLFAMWFDPSLRLIQLVLLTKFGELLFGSAAVPEITALRFVYFVLLTNALRGYFFMTVPSPSQKTGAIPGPPDADALSAGFYVTPFNITYPTPRRRAIRRAE
ncbi:MAG TPA: hypothetical protein VMT00_10320 [Thermoanaerobaculia bacterium]|nr:hypothetical protein [Thermoanaerobaculia bacterium]